LRIAEVNVDVRRQRKSSEAGPLSQWLFSALAEAGLPVICVETRHIRAALKAQINKTDRNDARGIAQMMRAGFYGPQQSVNSGAVVRCATGCVPNSRIIVSFFAADCL
jgi:transposase